MAKSFNQRELVTKLRNRRTGESVFTSSLYPVRDIDGRRFITIYTFDASGSRKILGSMAQDNFERAPVDA